MAIHGDLERPHVRAKLLTLLAIEGLTDREAAKVVSTTARPVSGVAVTKFRLRHMDDIKPLVAMKVETEARHLLGDKDARLAEYEWLYGLHRAEAEEYGVGVTEVRYESQRGSDVETRIETRDHRSGMVKAMTTILRSVAEETGQLPRATVEVSDRRTYVLQVVNGNSVPLG